MYKPTHTDQYLNFVSNHPSNTKDADIPALFRRARDIVSNSKDLDKENTRIVNVLMDNDYKKSMIMKARSK